MDTDLYIPERTILDETVLCFWQVNRNNTDFQQEIIIPKGTVEIIFNLYPEPGCNARLYDQNFIVPRCFIQGYQNQPIQLNVPLKQFFFGIVLHPAAVKHIFKVPAGELAGYCVDMNLVDPDFHSLWYRLAGQRDFSDRVHTVSNWLRARLPCLTVREKAFNGLLHHGTAKSVTELSGWLCYSPRQLSRKFYELTGMNTEQTLLYIKYLKAVQLMHASESTLTDIGFSCDFADQSHFIKTFKSFTGLTPKEYKINKSHIPGHIFTNVR